MKALCFFFWSAVMLAGFGLLFKGSASAFIFPPFLLLFALITLAADRLTAE
jgi:hypothetical protein